MDGKSAFQQVEKGRKVQVVSRFDFLEGLTDGEWKIIIPAGRERSGEPF